MSREGVCCPVRSRGRFATRFHMLRVFGRPEMMYGNAILFLFYMVFTNRDFNGK